MAQKVLVIDDGVSTAHIVEKILDEDFPTFDVLLAQRASDAFERFHLAQPALIVLNDTLPDAEAEAVCFRLLNEPATAKVPIALMSGGERGKELEEKYENVVTLLPKPSTTEALRPVIREALNGGKRWPHPSTSILFRDPGRIVFSGHTAFFSLRNALAMAIGDKITGVLRVFINQVPIELFFAKGRFLFATTRNVQLYCRDSSVILSSTNLGLITEAQINQHVTGCPIFLYLATRSGFPHDDVVQITREHGQRLFANLWTGGRLHFEFADLDSFPEYARNFPPTDDDPENWVLASLRHVKFDWLTAGQRPDPNGNPAYTRKGYELVQKLRLNDVEARFATAVNGTESLQSIAKKINVPLNDALLIVFRFQALEIIDYWSSSVLSLPATQTNPSGGEEKVVGSDE